MSREANNESKIMRGYKKTAREIKRDWKNKLLSAINEEINPLYSKSTTFPVIEGNIFLGKPKESNVDLIGMIYSKCFYVYTKDKKQYISILTRTPGNAYNEDCTLNTPCDSVIVDTFSLQSMIKPSPRTHSVEVVKSKIYDKNNNLLDNEEFVLFDEKIDFIFKEKSNCLKKKTR